MDHLRTMGVAVSALGDPTPKPYPELFTRISRPSSRITQSADGVRGFWPYSTTTRLTVSLQNGMGGSSALSVSTTNSSYARIIRRNQSWASRAVWMP